MSEPGNFGTAGRKFWTETMAHYGLSDSETLLLARICTILDTLTELDRAVAENGVMVVNDKGISTVNPAVAEARNQTIVLHRTVAALKLPDIAGNTIKSARVAAATTAATSRWKSGPARRPAAG